MADSNVLREDVVRVTIETDTGGLRTATQQTDRLANDLGRLGGAGNEAENSLNNLGGSAEQMGEDVEGANSELDMLRRISGQLDSGLATLTSILEELGRHTRRDGESTEDLRQKLAKLGQEKLEKLSNALDNIAKKLGGAVVNAAKSALTALRNFAVAGATAIGGLIAVGVNYNSTMEQFQTSFTTMLGSADKAVDFTEKLRQMAAATPFGMNDLAQASQTLLGYGIAEKEVLPYLKQLGDISQGNKDKLQGLTLAFSQAMSTGKLMGQDLLQMINQGFNPLKNIAERTGKSIGQLKEEMSKGAITAEMVAQAFEDATSEGGLFYNAMEKQSQTFNGQISTLKDNWSAFIGEMTSGIQELLKNTALPAINEQLKVFKEAFEEDGFRGIIRKFGVFGDYLEFCGDAILEMVNDGERMAILGAIGDDLGSTFMKLVDFIGQGVLKFVEWVTSAEGLTTIQGWIENLTNAIDWCIDNWDTIVEVTKNAVIVFGTVDGIVKVLTAGITAYNTIAGIAAFATSGLGAALGGLAVAALPWIAVGALVIGAIYAVWDVFTNKREELDTVLHAMGDGFTYIVDWWKGIFEGFGKWVDDTILKPIAEGWNNLVDGMQNWNIAQYQASQDPVGNWVDGAKALGWIPHAEGGLMTKPHLGVVGEDGPEMIIPLSADKRGSAVDMWQTTGNMLGVKSYGTDSLSGGNTVYGGSTNYAPTVNINVSGGSDRGTIRQIEEAVKEALEESFASALRRRPRETYV